MEELFLVKLLCAVAVLLSIIYQVDCFSSGAPGAACSSLSPDPTRHGAPPNTNSVPYNIDVSAFDVGGSLFYEPGNTYQSKCAAACVIQYCYIDVYNVVYCTMLCIMPLPNTIFLQSLCVETLEKCFVVS